MALAGIALLVRQYAGDEAAHGVGHGHGRDLAAGEHEVAERDFLIHAGFDKALVHALIMAADQHQMIVIPVEALCRLLSVGLSLGGHVNHAGAQAFRPLHHMIEAGLERLSHHHAAEAPAVGIVVHLLLPVLSKVPDLHAVDLHDAFGGGAADDALMQHGMYGIREEGQNVYFHLTCPQSSAP